jgi:hypothetical protein
MKTTLKWLSILVVLAVLLMAPATAATVKPVLIMADYKVTPGASTISPGPLMPGDTGTVVVTIANTFKGTTGSTSSSSSNSDSWPIYSSPPQGGTTTTHTETKTTSSTDTPQGAAVIKFVGLQDNGPVHIVSEPYTNPGSIGGGDRVPFEFKISVDQGAAPGTYYIELNVKTDDDSVYINSRVPVVVVDSGIKMVINEAPKSIGSSRSSVVLDVINQMQGGVNSVSVIPSGDAFSFRPMQEYTVGSIGAGEMYTVTFDVSRPDASSSGSPSFIVKYKNGDNWHQSGPATLNLDQSAAPATASSDGSGLMYLLGGIVLLAVLVGGLFLYMQGKRAKK